MFFSPPTKTLISYIIPESCDEMYKNILMVWEVGRHPHLPVITSTSQGLFVLPVCGAIISCELLVTPGHVIGRVHTKRHTHTGAPLSPSLALRCSLHILNAVLCRLKFRQLCSTEAVCVSLCVCWCSREAGFYYQASRGHLDSKHTVRQAIWHLNRYSVLTWEENDRLMETERERGNKRGMKVHLNIDPLIG